MHISRNVGLSLVAFGDVAIFLLRFLEKPKKLLSKQKNRYEKNTVSISKFLGIDVIYASVGGFPIKIETEISLLISYSFAIFIE